ncbi:hypothetical protein BH10PSE5_BH10PSE5_09460 [soil metagenome]
MLRSLLLTAAAMAALSGSAQAASADYLLVIQGVDGESESNNLKQLGLAGALRGCSGSTGAGRTTIGGPEIATSRGLAAAVVGGTRLKSAKLFARKSGGDAALTVEMTDVLISSAQPVSPTRGLPTTLTLSYGAMTWSTEGGGC